MRDETGEAIDRLTARLEGRAGTDWQPHMFGDRYDAMVGAIIAFRATVSSVTARFKLGQDEGPERLREIIGGLDDPALVRWIERCNDGRAA